MENPQRPQRAGVPPQAVKEPFPELWDSAEVWCGVGWHGILTELSRQAAKIFPPPQRRISEAKQKFGRLVVTTFGGEWPSHELFQLIKNAENAAAETCEDCGRPGELLCASGCLRTYCPECAKKGDFLPELEDGTPISESWFAQFGRHK